MKDKQAKYPQLRFKGFTDPWVQRKLADVVSISAGGDVDKTKLIEDGGYPVLANALTNSGIVGYYDSYKVEAPAVTVTGRGDVGHAVARHVNFTPVVRLLSLKSEVLDADFLANMLNQTNILVESTGVPQLTAPQLGSYKILYPNLNEQTKIGKLLNAFDNLIALHQRKLVKLKELKQGYLQKMFPKNGAKVPELRFAGFADDWEERKLSDLTESHNSGVYIPKDQYGEGTNIIGVGDIYDSDVVDGQRYRLAPVKDKRFILHTNDLLYGESSLVPEGIARVVSVSEAGAGTAFAWHTRRFKVNQVTLNSRFLGLELDYWLPARSHLMRSSTKTALTGITTQDFFNTQIVFPSKPEQEKIATLINSLDTAIALHQRKLDLLKEQKKGFLQKMFV